MYTEVFRSRVITCPGPGRPNPPPRLGFRVQSARPVAGARVAVSPPHADPRPSPAPRQGRVGLFAPSSLLSVAFDPPTPVPSFTPYPAVLALSLLAILVPALFCPGWSATFSVAGTTIYVRVNANTGSEWAAPSTCARGGRTRTLSYPACRTWARKCSRRL